MIGRKLLKHCIDSRHDSTSIFHMSLHYCVEPRLRRRRAFGIAHSI